MTFANAKLFCENEGTVLATIADGYQEAYVEIMVNKYGEKLWIGLVDDQVRLLVHTGCPNKSVLKHIG